MRLYKKYKYIIFTIIFISIAFFIFGLNSFHNNIWYDEAYQMILNRYPLSQVIYFVSQDFSPPLYAITFKIISTIFSFNDLIVARLLSFAVFSLLFVMAFFPIRRIFNTKVSFLFSILLLLVYPSFFASIEARTYSFAMTFTLCACVYALSIVKRNSFKDYLLYIIFSILAVYSHNYSIMAIFILDNMLLFYTLFKRRDLLKKVFISNMIVFIAFTPWISIVFNQAKNLASNFWILKPDLFTVKSTFRYLFTPNDIIDILLLLILVITILFIKKGTLKKAYFVILPFILTILFFFIYSLFKSPLFIPKYTVPVCALLYLFIAIILSKSRKNIIVLLFFCLLIPNFISYFKYEREISNDMETNNMITWIDNYTKDSDYAFYECSEFGLGLSEYYFPNKTHYLYKYINIYVTTNEIFGDVKEDYEKITEDTIVAFYPDRFALIDLKKAGYRVVGFKTFNIKYNSNVDVAVLKRV